MRIFLVTLTAGMALLACSESPAPQPDNAGSEPPAKVTQAETAPREIRIQAPAGQYRLDPNHAHLSFAIMHVGLADYIARFTDYAVQLDLDPKDISASSVIVTLNPASVSADYKGDYKATHQDSPYDSWNQDLAQSPKFFNAAKYPVASFQSTRIEPTDHGSLKVDGDLTLLGRTKPVSLDVEVTGSVANHPFTGNGALGLSAVGTIKRSDFGMDYLLDPPLLGNEVTIRFSGELHQAVQEAGDAEGSEE